MSATLRGVQRVFDADWSEDVELRDGDVIRLRAVRPEDKQQLQDGLQKLSPQSRYLRFFAAKPRLTDSELVYLTEVDGENHFAIVALTLDGEGEGAGIAVARFVRLVDAPRVAEPAIVVTDAFHNRGIGRVLLDRLVDAARERDIDTFRSELLASNTAVRKLLQGLSPQTRFIAEGSTVVAEVPIRTPSDAAGSALQAELRTWLRLAAQEALELRQRFAMLFDPEWVRSLLGRDRDPE